MWGEITLKEVGVNHESNTGTQHKRAQEGKTISFTHNSRKTMAYMK